MNSDRNILRARSPSRASALLITAALLLVTGVFWGAWANDPARPADSHWGPWIEPEFPFFSSVLDAREAGPGLPSDNLTPRALVLNLGRDFWAAFDTELLRVAAIWRGRAVTVHAFAPLSYHDPARKARSGQFPSPEPDGTVWLANGIYPGWQSGSDVSLEDPRQPAPSPEEVGRGSLPESLGGFKAVRMEGDRAVLEYRASGAQVREWMTVSEFSGGAVLERHFRVESSTSQPLILMLGVTAPDSGIVIETTYGGNFVELSQEDSVWVIRVPKPAGVIEFGIGISEGGIFQGRTSQAESVAAVSEPRWPEEVVTGIRLSTAADPYIVDIIDLPFDNPWRRNVRPGDVQFLKDGTGVIVTIDGDVWLVRGLDGSEGKVRWRRFTSGLHEPMTLAIRDEEIYVFDRNGIWRLRDTNGNGEADVHELFSNAFAQTADKREFANTIRLAPGGEFVIAKGGLQGTTLGRHNGSVLRISADGRRADVLGYGFRQPFIGVNVRTGLVTASDQQGQYVPSTPLHIVRDGQFYGFLSHFQPREEYPAAIAEPLTWIPHRVSPSGISQAWLFDARMGPLNDALVHIDFTKPELFRVLLNERSQALQAAVVSITDAFEFPLLNGSVNPADGQFYLTGFRILGFASVAEPLAGLGRVRYTGGPVSLPREVVPVHQGILLHFDVALDPERAIDPDSYSIASWHYLRTYRYGSPHYKGDGTPGQDRLGVSSAHLSQDGRSIFVAVPAVAPVMQLSVEWSLATAAGANFSGAAYLTPYELAAVDLAKEGFDGLPIDPAVRAGSAPSAGPVSIEEGRRLYQAVGCAACHSVDGRDGSAAGPPLSGLYGSTREIASGDQSYRIVADEAYLRESILNPAAKIVSGYQDSEAVMPSYAGVLVDWELDSLILFLKTLRKDDP